MTSKSGKREESAQFSLQELMKLEDERLADVRREEAKREAEREAAAARERTAAADRERGDTDARQREERAALEGLARREAMQKALVEQARLEVEVRARAEERELERRHELELERLRGAGRRGGLGALAGACAFGGMVMLGVTLGVFFGVTKPAADRRVAELEQGSAIADGRNADLERRLEEQRRSIDALERRLEAAALEIRLCQERRVTKAAPPGPVATGPRPGSTPAAPTAPPPGTGAACLKGDPMCAGR